MNKLTKIFILLSMVLLGYGLFVKFWQTTEVELESIKINHLNVSPSNFNFTDITQQAGIDFVHKNSAYGEKLLPETMGSGVAAVDIDNDGDVDLIFVSANRWPWQAQIENQPALNIYLNDGNGVFSKKAFAGINHSFYGVGIAVADVNADGHKDIFVTALGRNYLYLNTAGDFVESAYTAGVAGDAAAWGTGATFFDYDNDGDLDLFYGNYVKWDKQTDLSVNYSLTGIGKAYGPPTDFLATSLRLFNNDGSGQFTDVSIAAAIARDSLSPAFSELPLQGKSLVIQPLDIDDDGWLDFFVANDTTRNFLFHNLGNGKFEEQGEMLGVAYDSAGHATGAMGVDVGYFGENNEQIIVVGNFANEMTSYFVKDAKDNAFSELSILSGFGPATRKSLTFGVIFVDLDGDGRDDIFQLNGHVENEINQVQGSQHYRQPPQLFWNCGKQCATRFIPTETFDDSLYVGRGLAYADIDDDGDVDLIITQTGEAAVVLRNDTVKTHDWIAIKLKQQQGNADAIGAMVELQVGQLKQKKLMMPTRGYLSQSQSRLTFAIPAATNTAELIVRWPDATKSIHRLSSFNQTITIQKPAVQSDN